MRLHHLRLYIVEGVGLQFGGSRSESHQFRVQISFMNLEKVRVIRDMLATYEIVQRVGEVAYELALPTELAYVNPVFMSVC